LETAKLRVLGNCLVAFELSVINDKNYEEGRIRTADQVETEMQKSLFEFQNFACKQLLERRPFHWPIEFPEVFVQKGFDAIIGNPPFMGGRKISTYFGDEYQKYLRSSLLDNTKGSINFVLYFFLRTCRLLKSGGTAGLIATDTIKESDSRAIGLTRIFESCSVYRATSSKEWPGEAGVSICVLHMMLGTWEGKKILDEKDVEYISSMLEPENEKNEPFQLIANSGFCSDGIKVQGSGFILSDKEAQQIISNEPNNSSVITKYIVGDDLNNDPNQLGSRWVINFWNLPEKICEQYKIPWSILVERVKPYRDSLTKQVHESCFWKFWDRREDFFNRIKKREKIIVASKLSKHLVLTFGNPNFIYSEKVKVFDFSSYTAFAVLQSSFHIWWSLLWGSSTGETPAYVGTRCFDTFPFPNIFMRSHSQRSIDSDVTEECLEKIGKKYYDYRQALLLGRNETFTQAYNRFHNSEEHSEDIVKMRALHVELDQSIASAYCWNDIELEHDFYDTKLGLRYTISETARHLVLDSLLALNRQRHEEEVKAGWHDKKNTQKNNSKKKISVENGEPELF